MVVMKLILDIMEKFSKYKEPKSHNLKITLNVLELMIKRKKNFLVSSFSSNLVRGGPI